MAANRPAHGHRHVTRHSHHRHRRPSQSSTFTYTSPPVEPAPITSAALAPALASAEDAAVEYWGGNPCGGQVAITYVPQSQMPAASYGGVIGVEVPWAVATWGTETGTTTLVACTITFNGDVWNPTTEQTGFPDFCGLVVHEYGHFFGHPDQATDAPTSIMYPVVGPLNEGVASCTERYHGNSNT